jgi:hypothetical protein
MLSTVLEGKKATWRDSVRVWTSYFRIRLIMFSFSKRRIFSNYNNVMDTAIAAAKRPYSQEKPARGRDFFSDLMVEVYVSPRWREASLRCRVSLLETALALRAYKLEQGTYPNSLDALVPGYLPAVPQDPLNVNKPLRYKRDGAKYKLWSIGPDRKDDGGLPTVDTNLKGRGQSTVSPDLKGDFVYGINH